MDETIGMRQMHIRPQPGLRLIVQMKDGAQLACIATRVMVYPTGEDGIILYHKRKPVDESKARGWWPATLSIKDS